MKDFLIQMRKIIGVCCHFLFNNFFRKNNQQILSEDLQKWKRCMWFVPHALTAKQKERRLNHAYDLTEMIKSNPNFLDSIITGDESWCFVYDLKTKHQSSEWWGRKTPPTKKFRFQKSRVKTMLILFFDSKGVIHHEYMHLKVKQWMLCFTFKFWTICVSVLPVWGEKCGEIGNSFFSTIVRIRTPQRLSSSFWPKKEWHSWVTLHICQI